MSKLDDKIGAPLTANEIKRFDELKADALAIDNTLRIALQFHSNASNRIEKNIEALWSDVLETRGKSLDDGVFEINRESGISFVQKIDEEK